MVVIQPMATRKTFSQCKHYHMEVLSRQKSLRKGSSKNFGLNSSSRIVFHMVGLTRFEEMSTRCIATTAKTVPMLIRARAEYNSDHTIDVDETKKLTHSL